MSSSTFRINKVCQHCNKVFEAQKVTTKFCSIDCARKNYKLRAKLTKKEMAELETKKSLLSFKANKTNIEIVRQKDFISVNEAATLLNCNRKTVYRMISLGVIPAQNLLFRKTIIKRSTIDHLFESLKEATLQKVEGDEMVNIIDVQKRFNISYNGLSRIIRRNKLNTEKRGKYVFVSKNNIEQILS
jgi:excisionase family DNA binding protein